MKVLILGGSGFIGKNLSKKLNKKNEVVIVDSFIDYDFFKSIEISKTNLFELDLLNIREYSDIFIGVDAIFYLVNFTNPFLGLEDTKKAYGNDISVCLDILELSRENNIKKIIFSSSGGTVYGNIKNNEDRENDMTNPINNYGISKLTLEKIILMYNQIYGMNNIILRISNPYGEYQISDKVGIISIFLRKILNNENLEIFGDGTNIRDYIYIDDLIEIFNKILNKKKYRYDIYNIGSGKGKSILDIIKVLKEVTNIDFKVKFNENRNFDVKKNILDITRMKEEFKFSPKITLEEGIRKFYNHLKNN